jgi:UDP-GlcNAc3NAcA epimerase
LKEFKKLKVLTIIGARPQFIKAATVSRVIAQSNHVEEILVHTGQHFDPNMSDVFFNEMGIPKPQYNLGINSLNHGAMTGRMLEEIEKVLLIEQPDWVLVYGDTNSTLAGALAAKKLHIKVAHVEAGLRSFNSKMPEEVNRILTDRISDILFCPTETAMKNLVNEGYKKLDSRAENVGDVMYDAALFYSQNAIEPNDKLPENYAIATIHRAENTNDPERLKNIVNSFNEINKTLPIVLPLHPRTSKKLKEFGLSFDFDTYLPFSYFEIVHALKNAKIVLTDSGGMQKEAYFFEKPCVTLRDQTEWVELVHTEVNVLANTSSEDDIFNKFETMEQRKCSFDDELYGNGRAADKIINILLNY